MTKLAYNNVIGIERHKSRYSNNKTTYGLIIEGKGKKRSTVTIDGLANIVWARDWVGSGLNIEENTSRSGYSSYYTDAFYNGHSQRKLNQAQKDAIEKMVSDEIDVDYQGGDEIKAGSGYRSSVNSRTYGILAQVGVVKANAIMVSNFRDDTERQVFRNCLNLEHEQVQAAIEVVLERKQAHQKKAIKRNQEINTTKDNLLTTLRANGLYRSGMKFDVNSDTYWTITIPLDNDRWSRCEVSIRKHNSEVDVTVKTKEMDTTMLSRLQTALALAQTIVEVFTNLS